MSFKIFLSNFSIWAKWSVVFFESVKVTMFFAYYFLRSGIVINYKHFNGPRPKKTNKVVRSINKHTRFSEMDGDEIKSNQISPALYKVICLNCFDIFYSACLCIISQGRS